MPEELRYTEQRDAVIGRSSPIASLAREAERDDRCGVGHLAEGSDVHVRDRVAGLVVARVVRAASGSTEAAGLLGLLAPVCAREETADREAGPCERRVVRRSLQGHLFHALPASREGAEQLLDPRRAWRSPSSPS